jgi:hypothetical protein
MEAMNMSDEEEFEGAENARRAREKADRRPTKTSKKADPQDRPVDRELAPSSTRI